ncbi:MAG: hypothetical protein FJZ01_23280 [Candidatus Sericytochromatia bacterium]|nr:hypothetical protein [Candidatus Tanganyikabacteria bacterium]
MHLTEVPEPAVDLIKRYLATVYGSERDFPEHLACYAPEALVLVGPRVFKRQQLPLDVYTQTMSETADILDLFGPKQGGLRVPTLEFESADEAVASDDVAVVKATLRDRAADRTFPALFVFNDEGLLGAAVLEQAEMPDPAVAEAIVCAEHAQVPPLGGPHDLHLSGLELSYARVFAADGEEINYLPEARFSCQRCGESCRVGKWEIRVSDATRMAVEAMPWDRLRPGLRDDRELFRTLDSKDPTPFGLTDGLATRPGGEMCAFFDEADGCLIHHAVGRAVVPSCHKFPYMFTRTPDGVDVWTSFQCHAAIYGLGQPLAEREPDIRSRLWANRYHTWRVKEEVFLKSPAQPITWDTYRVVERALLDILDPADETPLEPRLQLGENFVRALEAGFLHEGFGPDVVRRILDETKDKPVAGRERRGSEDDLVVELFCLMASWDLPPEQQEAFLGGEFGALYASLLNQPLDWQPPVRLVAQFLRHCLFHKIFLQTTGIVFTWRYVLLSWAALRLYTRYLAFLESRAAHSGRVLTLARVGHPGATMPALELPTLPAGASAAHPLAAHIQKAIMDLDTLAVHYPDLFAGAFIERDRERERLIGPAVGSALIWG